MIIFYPMNIEQMIGLRNKYRKKEKGHTWRAAGFAGFLAVDVSYTAQNSINNLVSHLGQAYNSLPINLALDGSVGLFLGATVFSAIKAFSYNKNASNLDSEILRYDGVVAQNEQQNPTAPIFEVVQSTGTTKD